MSDHVSSAPAVPAPVNQPSTLELYASGFVLPCFSPTFYYHAARRGVTRAVGFFILFTLVIAALQALSLGIEMAPVKAEIEQAFQSGTVPIITISQGVATIQGRQPVVLVDRNRQFIVLDTTGRYTPADLINSGRYDTALLLTRTGLAVLNEGQLRVINLSDLQSTLGDPFEFNAAVIEWWLNVLQVIAFVALVIWNPIIGLAYVALIALLVWAVTAAIQRGVGFSPVFITGLYAFVPATYAEYMLRRSSVAFCGLGTLLLVAIWAVVMAVVLTRMRAGALREDCPLDSWRALIGVPMLFVLVLNVIFPRPVGAIVMWVVALLTALAFVAVALLTPHRPDAVAGSDAGSSSQLIT